MSLIDTISNNAYVEALDDERTIAVLFLVLSAYTFLESYSFVEQAARWPRYISVIAIVGCLLVLAKNVLPEPLRLFVDDESSKLVDRELEAELEEEQPADDAFDLAASVFTLAGTFVFVVLTLTAGYLVATVVFVAAFSWYFDIDYKIAAGYLVALLLVMYLLGQGLNIPLTEGLY